ncbi:hypothetical protein M5689_001102 [Euphorbia peplus]|nr:hypothetical protein M5689_001102 [Euphorbia peplus]
MWTVISEMCRSSVYLRGMLPLLSDSMICNALILRSSKIKQFCSAMDGISMVFGQNPKLCIFTAEIDMHDFDQLNPCYYSRQCRNMRSPSHFVGQIDDQLFGFGWNTHLLSPY